MSGTTRANRSSGWSPVMASSVTRMPRSVASSADASRRRATWGCSAGSASSTSRSGKPERASSARPGAYGPSNATTWLWLASGSSPGMPGYLAFSLSWAAKRLAATAASGELPQITGSVPIRSRAIDLPGLTNDSLVGRHWNAISSRPAATLSYTSSPTSTRPICSATTISGMHRLHSVDRGIPAETTGEKSRPGLGGHVGQRRPGRAHADQVAAAADRLGRRAQRLFGRPGAGHRDDQVGRADPARQLVPVRGDDLGGVAGAADGGENVAGDAGATHPRHHDGPGPVAPGDGGQVDLGAGPHGRPDLGRGRRHLAEHAAGIGRLDQAGIVEPVRGELIGQPVVIQSVVLQSGQVTAGGHAPTPGRRASSTSRTGMSSRTG